jgi:hypothetical protein
VKRELVNPRRAPRVPVRVAVELRDRQAAIRAESEDLGPRGLQVVSPRALAPGRVVDVRLHCAGVGEVVHAQARVVWARAAAPARLGLGFPRPASPRDWFDMFLRHDRAAAAAAARVPDRLPREAGLWLGEPPRLVTDFSADEVSVLRRIGTGTTAGALVDRLGPGRERARGAVFALLSRRLLVRSAALAVDPEAWEAVLSAAEAAIVLEQREARLAAAAGGAAANGLAAGPAPPVREPRVQALYDQGLAHLAAGKTRLAVERFREALEIAPGDEAIGGAVLRLTRWS